MAKSDLQQIQQKINTHKTNLAQNLENKQVEASADETLESLIGKINTISAGSAGNPPVAKCVDFRTIPGKMSVELYWSEIGDLKDSTGETYAAWAGTRVVRKEGTAPANENDGVIVTESVVMNQYAEEPYIDSGLEGKEYYYGLFPYTTDGVFAEGVFSVAVPSTYTIMTVVIDQSGSTAALSYEDNAVDMPSGKEAVEWDEFFGHRPCLFKDGKVVGYLNPDNFYQYEDGSDADITSGDSGDVMIEFPRRGLHIETINDKVYVKMTDNPNAEGFEYYAHERGKVEKDAFYISAYLPFTVDGKLRSIVKTGTTSTLTIAHTFNDYVNSDFDLLGFYQRTFIQAMFLLKYKSTDSQASIGYGYCRLSGTTGTTGSAVPANLCTTPKNGMDYGVTTFSNAPVKLFGIEYLWGATSITYGGAYVDSLGFLYTYTDANANFLGEDREKIANTSEIPGVDYANILKVLGSSKAGFFPKELTTNTAYATAYPDRARRTYSASDGKVNFINTVHAAGSGRFQDGIFMTYASGSAFNETTKEFMSLQSGHMMYL